MASTIDQIDSYLKKNKKTLFSKLNEWYGRNKPIYDGKEYQQAFDDAKNLKYLWNTAQEAKGINSKIEAFNKLTAELDKWTDLEKLEDWEKQLEAQGLENWQVPEDRIEMDKMRLFGQLSNRPEIDETTDLSIDGAFPQHYNFKQMRELAKSYGYDYNDKDERKEFLDKLKQYEQNKAIDKIWADDLYTTFITPVAKEYAKRNYQNIDSDDYIGTQGPKLPLVGNVGFGIPTNWDMTKALGADVVVNTLMAATPNKFGAPLYTAPVARDGANMALNKHSLEDAAKEATAETLTNIATPYALRGMYRWGARTKQGFEESAKQAVKEGAKDIQKAQKRVAQATLNESADKARDIQNKLKNGAAFNEGNKFYKFSKDGKKLEITDDAELSFRPVISQDDYNFYLKNKDVLRGKQWGPDAESANANMERLPDILDDISNLIPDFKRMNDNLKKYIESEVPKERKAKAIQKLRENIKSGKPATEGISAEDLALITDKEAKESKLNWATAKVKDFGESDFGKMAADYVTNLQGQTKYGGTMANAIAQGIPFVKDKVNLEVEKKPDVKNDPELQLLERIYSLHKKYPNMVGKPKLPEKWEKNYTIEEIFGK